MLKGFPRNKSFKIVISLTYLLVFSKKNPKKIRFDEMKVGSKTKLRIRFLRINFSQKDIILKKSNQNIFDLTPN